VFLVFLPLVTGPLNVHVLVLVAVLVDVVGCFD